jgi:P-type Ca2+ transporter type 2C
MSEKKFHEMTSEEVLSRLGSAGMGLSSAEAESRLREYGPNEIPEGEGVPWWKVFLRQFKNLLVFVLLAAAAISYATHHMVDMWVILGIILINAIIGFVQEMKAEKATRALKSMLVAKARVVRDGEEHIVASRMLVPGDIIVLEEGESIPADARLIEAKDLRCIEASLTGESLPVGKHTRVLPADTPLADRKNMILKGTFTAGGYAKAVVCGTGLNTAIGSVATSLASIEELPSNFRRKTDRLAKQMAMIAIGSASLLFAVGYLRETYEKAELLLISIAALVSSIPEGLPAVLTIVLAIGSNRMAGKKAIVREMTAVETLGSVSTIITDKTGTLTQNTLTVKKVWMSGEQEFDISGDGWFPVGQFMRGKAVVETDGRVDIGMLLRIAAVSNNAQIKHKPETDVYELIGDPTEGALRVLAKKGGADFRPEDKKDDLPFNSKLKMRATLYDGPEGTEILVVGAPEKLLEKSASVLHHGQVTAMNPSLESEYRAKIEEWSDEAMRVIGLARKPAPGLESISEDDLTDLCFVGLTGMIDPPAANVLESVKKCHRAGIRVIMATGDHINTALAIARATGIVQASESKSSLPQAMTEQQLAGLDDSEFRRAVSEVNVFARLTPNMKLKICEALQKKGELVAMTGDGVNDAPALKKADVGVAMGVRGTDVARQSAQVVLADDNFSTIVAAVEQGRIVFANARQVSFFLVTTNFAEITVLLLLVFLGYPMALTATQILWLNLVTDGVGDKALATEQGHGDELNRKPIKQSEGILNREVIPFMVIMVLLMTCLAMLTYFWNFEADNPDALARARTMTFIVMAFTQLFNVFNMRSVRESVFKIGIFSNRWVNLAFLVGTVLQVVIIEIPFFQNLFDFRFVSPFDFFFLFVMSSSVLWAGEIVKYVRKEL